VDENIDDNAENRGIEPLPNLELEFVTANTLIGLQSNGRTGNNRQRASFDFANTVNDIERLKAIRVDYLQAEEDKEELREKFLDLQKQIAKKEFDNVAKSEKAIKITNWNPFCNEKADWFEPILMFGVKKFDIVIGNPPYGAKVSSEQKQYIKNNYFCCRSDQEGRVSNLFCQVDWLSVRLPPIFRDRLHPQ